MISPLSFYFVVFVGLVVHVDLQYRHYRCFVYTRFNPLPLSPLQKLLQMDAFGNYSPGPMHVMVSIGLENGLCLLPDCKYCIQIERWYGR